MLTFGLNLLYCQSTGNVPEVYTLHCRLVQTVQHTQHVVSSVMSTVLICIVTSHSTLFKEHFSPSLLHSARLHNDLGDTQCLHGNQSPQSDWWLQTLVKFFEPNTLVMSLQPRHTDYLLQSVPHHGAEQLDRSNQCPV